MTSDLSEDTHRDTTRCEVRDERPTTRMTAGTFNTAFLVNVEEQLAHSISGEGPTLLRLEQCGTCTADGGKF